MSDLKDLSAEFHRFARVEAPDLESAMYAELSYGVSLDDELLALASRKRSRQPAPNMLFAAVQYLLLSGVEHSLAMHYPGVSGEERPHKPAFPMFRAFCLEHREQIARLIASRSTQTQVVRRCTCLLPVFSLIYRESTAPLALIDIGASGGLNLNFDRYAYHYRRDGSEAIHWGQNQASVTLDAELRGPGKLPLLAESIPIASRDGIDLNPIDLSNPDQLLWQRALIWPEHRERHRQLIEARAELDESPVRLHRGDATELLPGLLMEITDDMAPVVYSTITLYQFPRASLRRLSDGMAAYSRERPVWQVALEGVHPPSLTLTRYRDGSGESELLARASPHGWWIEWQKTVDR